MTFFLLQPVRYGFGGFRCGAGSPTLSRLLLTLVVLSSLVWLAGCRADDLLAPTPVPGAAATAARAAATPIPTPAQREGGPGTRPTVSPAAAPESAPAPRVEVDEEREMQAAVSTIQTALATHDFADVEALMLEEVAVSVEEVGGETMSRTAARAWLAQRLGPDLRLEEWRTVEHYGLLEVITVGWQPDEQATAGRITFNLHRFDDQGRQDALRGSWKIDVIVAE